VLEALCDEVRMEGLPVLEMWPKSGCVPVVLGGAMISVWVGCWRSQVPRFIHPSAWKRGAPKFSTELDSEVRIAPVLRG